jgi:hypothetical protein
MKTKTIVLQVWTLAKKDFYVWESYKSQVTTALLSVAFGLFSWAILGSYSNKPVPQYDTNFISFLVIGILVSSFVLPLSQGLQNRLNPWTFETVLLSGVRMPVFVVGGLLWQVIFQGLTLIPQLMIAVYIFNIQLSINLFSTMLAFAITMVIVVCLAMIDMGIRVVTKQADPILWALIVAQGIGSGMLYPVQQLNSYIPGIATLSWAIPFTWIYHLIRISVLANGSLLDPVVALSFLEGALYCCLLIPLSIYALRWGMRRAKRDGTLGWY